MTAGRAPVPRATRYPLNLPVRFRVSRTDHWSYGTTVNISHTGVLLRTSASLAPNVDIDLEVVLPGDVDHSTHMKTVGRVIRSLTDDPEPGDATVAVALGGHGFVQLPRSRPK